MSYCILIENLPENKKALVHDPQYGLPIHNDKELLARSILEINQAGLSWEIILKKQENFCKGYDDFDLKKVAA